MFSALADFGSRPRVHVFGTRLREKKSAYALAPAARQEKRKALVQCVNFKNEPKWFIFFALMSSFPLYNFGKKEENIHIRS
ncbi:hypothetical protein CEW92_11105 [Bacillaceae bacterium SAS-127]|nr:hypothetical protein CEW92_11105 [Bacillaceae bacterium SAS-127]